MANHQDVLARARHKWKREVETLETNPLVLTSTTAAPSPPVVTPAIKTAQRPMETPLAPERYKRQNHDLG